MKKYLLFVGSLFTLLSCNNQEVVETNSINDFTWRAMNSWYKWQENVPNLNGSKIKNNKEYQSFINSEKDPKKFFNSLLYKKGLVDRFSWFIEDYEEQLKSFQGIEKSFGFSPLKINLDKENTILLVSKVSKNSPASRQGFKRGDIIIGLNNQKFTQANFKTVIKGYFNNSVEFIFGEKDGVTETKRITITREEVADDAIHFVKVFNDIAGKKVGYFVYNGFRASYNNALNEVFGKFKTEGIQELILDLRYNHGGSVTSSGYLASMIYGQAQADKDIFAKTIWNKKHPNRGYELPFSDVMNSFDKYGNYIEGEDISINRINGLTRLFVITSHETASASEMIINGLKPYMEVITVGEKTYGKNVGSVTLFDSPESNFTNIKTAKSSHKYAMQPITFQIYNKLDQSDYTQGFAPDILVDEKNYWNDFKEFGDENEIILKTILDKIKGNMSRSYDFKKSKYISSEVIDKKPFDYEMYFENEYLNQIK